MWSTLVQVLAALFYHTVAAHSWSDTDRDDSGSYVCLELLGHLQGLCCLLLLDWLRVCWRNTGHFWVMLHQFNSNPKISQPGHSLHSLFQGKEIHPTCSCNCWLVMRTRLNLVFTPDVHVPRQHTSFLLLRKMGSLGSRRKLEIFLRLNQKDKFFKVSSSGSYTRNNLDKEKGCGWHEMFNWSLGGGAVINNETAKAGGRMSLEMRWRTERHVWMS